MYEEIQGKTLLVLVDARFDFELSGDDCNNIGRAGEQATRLHEVYHWLPSALIRVI